MDQIATVASTLAAGQFAKLTIPGYDATFTNTNGGGTDNCMGFAAKAAYTWENGGRVWFGGGGHPQDFELLRSKFWYYDCASNTCAFNNKPDKFIHSKSTGVSTTNGGTRLVLTAPNAFTAVDMQVYVKSGTNFKADFYTHITNIVSPTLIDVAAPVTPSGEGSNGVIYIDGRFRHSLSWCGIDPARRLFLYPWPNNTGFYYADLDFANPTDALAQEFKVLTTDLSGLGTQYSGSLDVFPERNEYVFFQHSPATLNRVNRFNRNTQTWAVPDEIDMTNAQLAIGSVYCSKRKCIIFVGGYQVSPAVDNFKVHRLNLNGTYTQLSNCPVPTYFSGYSLMAEDPVSGDVLLFTTTNNVDIRCFVLNVVSGAWTERTDIAANYPVGMGVSGNRIFGTVVCTLVDRGLIFFFGNYDCWIYKHTANNWAVNGAPKELVPGNLAKIGFDTFNDIKMANWNTSIPALDAAMLARGHIFTSSSPTTYPHCRAQYNMANVPSIPTIDNTIYYAAGGGTGSLRLDVIAPVDQNGSGFFQSTITRDTLSPYRYISPISPDGNILYFQFRTRLDDAMLNTIWRDRAGAYYTGLACGVGSRTLTATSRVFEAVFVGRNIFIQGGTGFVQGSYLITSFNAAGGTSVTLDPGGPSPCPSTAGSGGIGEVGGDPFTDMWKGTVTVAAGAPDVLVFPAGHPYPASIPIGYDAVAVGNYHPNGAPWIDGWCTVQAKIDATHLQLNRNVVTSGLAAANGWIFLGGDLATNKITIELGNHDNSPSSSSRIESTSVNYRSTGYMHMYGMSGNQGYAKNYTQGFLKETWHEVTIRIEVRGNPFSPTLGNDPASRITWWIDGQLAADEPGAEVGWNDPASAAGEGFGQFYFTLFSTNKDPTQMHATAYQWFDDVFTSTQPIPFGASSTAEPPPTGTPAGPILPWTLRS